MVLPSMFRFDEKKRTSLNPKTAILEQAGVFHGHAFLVTGLKSRDNFIKVISIFLFGIKKSDSLVKCNIM
jgi:hypothetical protein